MMYPCFVRVVAILKDEETPFWDKAEAIQWLKDNRFSNIPFEEWLKLALRGRL